MTPSIKKILDEVNKLSPFERVKIIDLILESFDDRADKEIEAAWIDEAKIRIDSYTPPTKEEILAEINYAADLTKDQSSTRKAIRPELKKKIMSEVIYM